MWLVMDPDTISPQVRREFSAILNEFLEQLHGRGIRFSMQVEGRGTVELSPAEVLAFADNPQAWLRQLQGQ